MAFQLSWTDPTTGVQAPQAYAKVDDASIQLASDAVNVTVDTYYNQAARTAALAPVHRYPVFVLGQAEVNAPNPAFVTALAAQVQAGLVASPRDALLACLYVLLKSRTEFTGATDV